MRIILILIQILSLVVPVLIAVAYLTLVERKIIASMQRRKGPNVVGFLGLLQPLADGAKLFLKETILPNNANLSVFLAAPVITLMLSLISWSLVPFELGLVFSDLNLGILFIFAISGLSVYGILISGWSSNSKYAFLGSLRSAAQMVSYEVSIGFLLMVVILSAGTLNLSSIVIAQDKVWFCIPFLPVFLMFLIAIVAETNRHPFDLPEAEAELVAGYNVEYSAMGFALFFIGEYANILMMSALTVICFLGGWLPFFDALSFIPGFIWFGFKMLLMVFFFVWIRAGLPRYRYDQLMRLGWKVLLPLSLGTLLFYASFLLGLDYLPY